MTIYTTTARANGLAAVGQENNPFVTGAQPSGTYSTGNGTEVSAADNAVTGDTFDYWTATPDGSGFAAWKVDFGTDRSPTFVGIAAHNISDVGGSVTVQHSSDDTIWSTLHSETPADNAAIGFRFGATTDRYWRILLSGLSGDVSIGVIWIGAEIIIPQRIYQGTQPPLTANVVNMVPRMSEGGQFLGSTVISRGATMAAQIDHLQPSFVRGTDWLGFQTRFNEGRGFFWAWRPGKYGDLWWAKSAGTPIAPTNSGPNELMSLQMQMRLYHDY
jgi:hypothetical protein